MFNLKIPFIYNFLHFYIIIFLFFSTTPIMAQQDSALDIEGDLLNKGYLKVYSIKFLDNPVIIKKESFPIIDSIATLLLKNPRIRLEVASYAEAKNGEDEKSIIEKEIRKAKAVCSHLAYKGVTDTRFTCKGYRIQKKEIQQTLEEPVIGDSSETVTDITDTVITDSSATDTTGIQKEKIIITNNPEPEEAERPRIEFRIISR